MQLKFTEQHLITSKGVVLYVTLTKLESNAHAVVIRTLKARTVTP